MLLKVPLVSIILIAYYCTTRPPNLFFALFRSFSGFAWSVLTYQELKPAVLDQPWRCSSLADKISCYALRLTGRWDPADNDDVYVARWRETPRRWFGFSKAKEEWVIMGVKELIHKLCKLIRLMLLIPQFWNCQLIAQLGMPKRSNM